MGVKKEPVSNRAQFSPIGILMTCQKRHPPHLRKMKMLSLKMLPLFMCHLWYTYCSANSDLNNSGRF